MALCHHGNIYPARQTSSPSPTHVQPGKQAPEKCGLSESRCLVIGQLEVGAWNGFTPWKD